MECTNIKKSRKYAEKAKGLYIINHLIVVKLLKYRRNSAKMKLDDLMHLPKFTQEELERLPRRFILAPAERAYAWMNGNDKPLDIHSIGLFYAEDKRYLMYGEKLNEEKLVSDPRTISEDDLKGYLPFIEGKNG